MNTVKTSWVNDTPSQLLGLSKEKKARQLTDSEKPKFLALIEAIRPLQPVLVRNLKGHLPRIEMESLRMLLLQATRLGLVVRNTKAPFLYRLPVEPPKPTTAGRQATQLAQAT